MSGDPVAYVISLNLHRRHLTASQRSMVAARAREFYDRQAKERMSEGGKEAGKGRPKQGKEKLPDPIGQSRDQAGKAAGVSGKMVDFASKVLDRGQPELIRAVDEGRLAVAGKRKKGLGKNYPNPNRRCGLATRGSWVQPADSADIGQAAVCTAVGGDARAPPSTPRLPASTGGRKPALTFWRGNGKSNLK